MASIETSEIVEKLLTVLLDITRRKTNETHAFYTLETVINQLKNQYDFLEHIHLKDTLYSEDDDTITIMKDINKVNTSELGIALQDILTSMYHSLGKNAGYFFMKEIQEALGDEYISSMKEIGVDLGLLQLESEIEELEKTIMQRR